MADNKKSFLLYCDLIHTFEHLTLEQRGEVITWLLRYTNDLNPEPLNGLLQAVIEPIKQQLKRDLKKYENIVDRNRSNGSKGGRPKNPKKPTGLTGNPKKPKKPDTDTDTDTDTVKENKDIPDFSNFLEYSVKHKPKLNPEELKLKYLAWVENGWKDGYGNPILNWKIKILNTLPYISETTRTVNTNPVLNREDFFTE